MCSIKFSPPAVKKPVKPKPELETVFETLLMQTEQGYYATKKVIYCEQLGFEGQQKELFQINIFKTTDMSKQCTKILRQAILLCGADL